MDCQPQQIEQILKTSDPVTLVCDLHLTKNQSVTKDLIISTSGITVSCDGGTLNNVFIRSPATNGVYSKISNITLRGCTIKGGIRISGHSVNGQGAVNVTDSQTNPDHTYYTQSVAPTSVMLDRIWFTPNGQIPLYLSPGVNGVTVQNSTLGGTSNSVAIYMDAESGKNVIRNNAISTKTKRELFAIDGSAKML